MGEPDTCVCVTARATTEDDGRPGRSISDLRGENEDENNSRERSEKFEFSSSLSVNTHNSPRGVFDYQSFSE